MKKKVIYLLRHGAIDTGEEKRFIGTTDLPLTSAGVKQGQSLGRFFRSKPIEAVYCSSLSRSVQTAEQIANHLQIQPVIKEDLREIHLGTWEGISFREIRERDPEGFERRGQDMRLFTPPGGEPLLDCYARAVRVFREITDSISACGILVGHSGLNKLILCSLLEIPPEHLFRLQQDYGCVNEIHLTDNQIKVVSLNNLSVVGEAESGCCSFQA